MKIRSVDVQFDPDSLQRPGEHLTHQQANFPEVKDIEKNDKGLSKPFLDPVSLITGKVITGTAISFLGIVLTGVARSFSVGRTEEGKLMDSQRAHDNMMRDRSFRSREQAGVDRMESRQRGDRIKGGGETRQA